MPLLSSSANGDKTRCPRSVFEISALELDGQGVQDGLGEFIEMALIS